MTKEILLLLNILNKRENFDIQEMVYHRCDSEKNEKEELEGVNKN